MAARRFLEANASFKETAARENNFLMCAVAGLLRTRRARWRRRRRARHTQ